MSDDKVISMEDFRKTERELDGNPELAPKEELEGVEDAGFIRSMLVEQREELFAAIEQGRLTEGKEKDLYGIVLTEDELSQTIEELVYIQELMQEYKDGGENW